MFKKLISFASAAFVLVLAHFANASSNSFRSPAARYSGNNLPAVAMKKCDGYTSIYYGAKVLQADFVREIAKFAGVHIYSESDDVLYVGNGLLTIHASTTNIKTIHLPKEYKIIEAYSGADYGYTNNIEIKLKLGQTVSFYLTEREESNE